MRDYVFVNKDTQAKATLRTDIIDGNERFTIMVAGRCTRNGI